MTAPDLLTVKLGGQQLDGWTGYRITRGVEKLPSGMVLEFTERYPALATQVLIAPGTAFTASLGSDLVLTGYADLYWPHEDDANRHIVRVEGALKDLRPRRLQPLSAKVALPPWTMGVPGRHDCQGAVAQQLVGAKSFLHYCYRRRRMSAKLDEKVQFPINPGETVAELLEQMARVTCGF